MKPHDGGPIEKYTVLLLLLFNGFTLPMMMWAPIHPSPKPAFPKIPASKLLQEHFKIANHGLSDRYI